jgi:hypothetical protein
MSVRDYYLSATNINSMQSLVEYILQDENVYINKYFYAT